MARTQGDNISADQELIISAIEDDSYFYENVVPTGAINGANTTFTLPAEPNPTDSFWMTFNGQVWKSGNGYTVTGTTLELDVAPISGDEILCFFRADPT